MNTYLPFTREKANGINASGKIALTAVCLVFMFLLTTHNVWGAITIQAGGKIFKDPLRVELDEGEWHKFKATAIRTNPHGVLAPVVRAPGVPDNPGVPEDPKLGRIEILANGEPKKGFFQNPKKTCKDWFGLFCGSTFTHSIEYKWKIPGIYEVTATIYDVNGKKHDSVTWWVQVGNPFEELNIRAAPSLPRKITTMWGELKKQ